MPGPGVLRPRRRGGDGHGRQHRPRAPRSGALPRRRACGSTRSGRRRRSSASPSRSGCRSRRRRRDCRLSRTRTWRGQSARARSRRATTRETSRSSPSAARARCTRRRWRPRWASRRCSCPPYPGITSAIGLLTSDLQVRPDADGLHGRGRDRPPRARPRAGRAGGGASAQLEADGVPPESVAVERASTAAMSGRATSSACRCPRGRFAEAALAAFHRLHEPEYGHAFQAIRSRSSTCGSRRSAAGPKLEPASAAGSGSLDEALRRRGRGRLPRRTDELATRPTRYYERWRLPARKRRCRTRRSSSSGTRRRRPARLVGTADRPAAISSAPTRRR